MSLHLTPLDPDLDAATIHGWVVEERAQFWMMRDHSLEEVREIYGWIVEQPTHAAFLIRDADEPVGLFQTYDPRAEEIGEHVDVRDGDLGVHLMLAPAREERPGFTWEVLTLLAGFVFGDGAVHRVLVEPDARNDKALARVASMGFELGEVVQLSTKPARVGWLTRETYESVFSKNSSA